MSILRDISWRFVMPHTTMFCLALDRCLQFASRSTVPRCRAPGIHSPAAWAWCLDLRWFECCLVNNRRDKIYAAFSANERFIFTARVSCHFGQAYTIRRVHA